jgi:hypothetical protein
MHATLQSLASDAKAVAQRLDSLTPGVRLLARAVDSARPMAPQWNKDRMTSMKPKATPERDDNDESLRQERYKSDRAVHSDNTRASEAADAVVEQARGDADAMLRTAPETAQPSPNPMQLRPRRCLVTLAWFVTSRR